MKRVVVWTLSVSIMIIGCKLYYSDNNTCISRNNELNEVIVNFIETGTSAAKKEQSITENYNDYAELTYLQVEGVISTKHDIETIGTIDAKTLYNHGGADLFIVTKEIGIGHNGCACLNDEKLECIYSKNILDNSKIVGKYNIWNASGYQKGQFKYSNRSLHYPYNTLKDTIYIR